jgi:putative transcriptional regulator
MSDDSTIKARRTPDGGLEQILPDGTTRPLEIGTDWTRFDAITDEEAYQNALDDPDNPPLTPERLAKMRRVPKPERVRLALGLTQEEFSRQFEISLGTLRDWEQGVRHLDRTAVSYLTVIEMNPEAVRQALHPESPDRLPTAEEEAEARRRRVG